MNDPVREQVINLMRGGQAHLTFDEVIKDFPAKLRGSKPNGAPHTAWQLLEHRFTVREPGDVQLVCELRAVKGQAWFDLPSLQLVRD